MALFQSQVWASAALALVSIGLMGDPAQAGFLQEYSGNHRAYKPLDPGLDHTFNFAVLENDYSGQGFGTGLADFGSRFVPGVDVQNNVWSNGFDTSARYLYLYQMVNSGPGQKTPREFGLFIPDPSVVTSFGAWDNLMLADNGGRVSDGNAFGSDTAPYQPGAPANVGVSGAHVAEFDCDDDGVCFGPVSSTTLLSGQSFTVENPRIPAGGVMQLIGFTSNLPPELFDAALCNPSRACGSFPIPVPEPNLAILSLLSVGLMGSVRRRLVG